MLTKKSRGYMAENIALEYYLAQGWILVQKNFTIPGGEIDLILIKNGMLNFVEVKDVSYVDDISDYITPMKRKHIKRTMQVFLEKKLHTSPDEQIYYTHQRCDVVFIKKGQVYIAVEDCVDF